MKKINVLTYAVLLVLALLMPIASFCQDVRFLVDESGSMEITDPQKLRIPALKLITHLLPGENISGIWGFSSTTHVLVPLGKVSASWRELAKLKAHQINSNGQYTNIGRAIEAISKDWFTHPWKEDRIIILLTDGQVDISNYQGANIDEKRRILYELIPKLKKYKISVYTIGLSNKVDRNLMSQLAYQTNGTFQIVNDPAALEDSYYYVFNAAVDSNEVPIINNTFRLDDTIKQVTLILFKGKQSPITLVTPEGLIYPLEDARRFSTTRYTFITITNPKSGMWQIRGLTSNNNRALIFSKIGLATKRFKHHLFAGEKTVTYAYITNHGKRVKNKIMLDNTKIQLKPGDNDALELNKPDVFEINYRKEFYLPRNLTGDVLFQFTAISKTFQRLKSQLVKIEKFPFEISFRRKNEFMMQIHVVSHSSTIAKSNLKADIYFPAKKEMIAFKQYSPHKYYSNFAIKCMNDKFHVKLSISGTKINREPYEFEPMKFDLDCRKSKKLKSFIESINTKSLVMKETYRKKITVERKKRNKNNIWLPMFLPILILTLLAVLSSIVIKRKQQQTLKNILKDLTSDIDDDEDPEGEEKDD